MMLKGFSKTLLCILALASFIAFPMVTMANDEPTAPKTAPHAFLEAAEAPPFFILDQTIDEQILATRNHADAIIQANVPPERQAFAIQYLATFETYDDFQTAVNHGFGLERFLDRNEAGQRNWIGAFTRVQNDRINLWEGIRNNEAWATILFRVLRTRNIHLEEYQNHFYFLYDLFERGHITPDRIRDLNNEDMLALLTANTGNGIEHGIITGLVNVDTVLRYRTNDERRALRIYLRTIRYIFNINFEDQRLRTPFDDQIQTPIIRFIMQRLQNAQTMTEIDHQRLAHVLRLARAVRLAHNFVAPARAQIPPTTTAGCA